MHWTQKTLVMIAMFAVAAVGVARADDVDDLIAALTGDDNEARRVAANAAGPLGAKAIEPLGELAASKDYLVARAARWALVRVVADAGVPGADPGGEVSKALLKLAQPGQPAPTRREAIHLLGWSGRPENVAPIAELLMDPDIADSARMALQRIPGEAVAAALIAAAPNVDDEVKPGVFYAIARRGADDAIPTLMEMAKSNDPAESWAAFDVLTRLGVAPLEIIPRTHAKDLADRKRYANGFLRAADVRLARGEAKIAERMYASVAAFPISPQHACAALIGLKNAQSPKLIEHALGYLLERGIADVAKSTLVEADVPELDEYLMRAYAVTNPAKQRVLLEVIAARQPDGADRFLNEARHNESAMVRFTAARLLGDVPDANAFEAAVESAPVNVRGKLARSYYALAVAEERSGDAVAARDMAHVLIKPEISPRIRQGGFAIIERVGGAESAPVLRELIGGAFRPDDESEDDPFDGIRSLTIAAGRAYVATHAAAAKDDPAAIDEIALVAENAFHAEVANFAADALKKLGGESGDIAKKLGFITEWRLLGPFIDPDSTVFEAKLIEDNGQIALEEVVFNGDTFKWEDAAVAAAPAIVDLQARYGDSANSAAYAYAEVYWEGNADAAFLVGTNDGCMMWLNGEPVHEVSGGRGLQVDQDKVNVKLESGNNRILLKVLQEGGAWGFCVRLVTTSGDPIDLAMLRPTIYDPAYL